MKNRNRLFAGLAATIVGLILFWPANTRALPADTDADSQLPQNDIMGFNGFGNNSSSYTLRFTSSAHIIPGDFSRGSDLGSPNKQWRALYVSTMFVNDGSNVNISTRNSIRDGHSRNTFLNLEPNSYVGVSSGVSVASAGVTIVPTGSYLELTSSAGPLMMTAIPTIATATARPGDILIIRSATATITFQEKGLLANSGLSLGATTRALGVNDTLFLIFGSTMSVWTEIGFGNNQP